MAKNEDLQDAPEQFQAPAPKMKTPKGSAVQALDTDAFDTGRLLARGPKREISLMAGGPSEPKTVPVIINGYRYEVQRGVDVEVPEQVAILLRDAGYR
jgi:hypothetical protein